MPLLLLLRLSFGLFARFCVLHIHIPFLHLCFCLFVFLYLSTPSLSSSSPSFFAHSLPACNLLVAFTYRALLFLFKLLENLPEYKYSHSLPHPSASSKYTGYVYRSILQHPNRTRTNRTTLRELCVCERVYVLSSFEFFCCFFRW